MTARAYPVGDEQIQLPNSARNRQRLLQSGRLQLKKGAPKSIRIGTLDVGTTTGHGREVADMMERRKRILVELGTWDYEDVDEWWEQNNSILKRVGREVLGMSTGKRPRDKETWWCSNYVQEKIKIKRNAKNRYDETGTDEDKERSKLARKEAKVAVAQSKQQALDNVHEDLDAKEGLKKIYKIAKEEIKRPKILPTLSR
ncbi:uncharacterized protein [Palaemon carinicauda]|uniref:uncharacterized protein n=1 Tax=Palaemon carinicauda TaxID=392227 RepID=UPI0035B66E63